MSKYVCACSLSVSHLTYFQDITICGHKVNRLKLAQAKLQNDPSKAALKLLSCLFDTEVLVNGNPTGSTNSKEEQRQATIKKLDPDRMKYLQGNNSHYIEQATQKLLV